MALTLPPRNSCASAGHVWQQIVGAAVAAAAAVAVEAAFVNDGKTYIAPNKGSSFTTSVGIAEIIRHLLVVRNPSLYTYIVLSIQMRSTHDVLYWGEKSHTILHAAAGAPLADNIWLCMSHAETTV